MTILFYDRELAPQTPSPWEYKNFHYRLIPFFSVCVSDFGLAGGFNPFIHRKIGPTCNWDHWSKLSLALFLWKSGPVERRFDHYGGSKSQLHGKTYHSREEQTHQRSWRPIEYVSSKWTCGLQVRPFSAKKKKRAIDRSKQSPTWAIWLLLDGTLKTTITYVNIIEPHIFSIFLIFFVLCIYMKNYFIMNYHYMKWFII